MCEREGKKIGRETEGRGAGEEKKERERENEHTNLFLRLDDRRASSPFAASSLARSRRRRDQRRVDVDRRHVIDDDRDPEALPVLQDPLEERRLPGAQEAAEEGHGESCCGGVALAGEGGGLDARVLGLRHGGWC